MKKYLIVNNLYNEKNVINIITLLYSISSHYHLKCIKEKTVRAVPCFLLGNFEKTSKNILFKKREKEIVLLWFES